MLDAQTIATIKSTIPLIAKTGPALTAHFYDRMFSRHPELKDIFTMSHQSSGAQREALFNAICAYATHLEDLPAILPAVEKIAQKHASLNILPEHYPIVGENLLATIDEMFNPGKEVLDAWGAAYQVLADVFINREEQIYQQKEQASGGWRGLRHFKVKHKVKQSEVITSFELEPEDGQAVTPYRAGQYLSIYIRDEKLANQEIRQYSLTQSANNKTYRIAVKREDKGILSNFLHDHIQEGDILQVAAPGGDFYLDISSTTPVTLISAGVGLTPMLAMLHTLSSHQAQVNWLHAAEHGGVHAFREEIAQAGKQIEQYQQAVWYRIPRTEDIINKDYQFEGLMDLTKIHEWLSIPNMQFYFCGPLPFMQSVAKQLIALGIESDKLHYECFGPHAVISQ
ncbi:NO-inducible flavohemoprotein [Proteus mirabilis]|uniref:NO-inducible flavohemoprotein n=1 Tax=Proteus mirabilis TaxID=584 RepID=UPI002349B99F|nr:NO-inducible flavohemoprotein [Proteus mirabilis]MDC5888235.1 NO-inducible flavohemoprotein [Proteus mirabilis]MDC5895473.1 NO-inducible flavohemoprotein [Proteus mirabilis]MDC5905832.1 NO-inducible flavohemoprotein [Proteus mirabilis]MDC5909375.1 NO-inducible flavohemoprotein [Proteus mirabilis]MDC5916608.1 NO-inducible flavohemoprotein [Proteus mirabilis]